MKMSLWLVALAALTAGDAVAQQKVKAPTSISLPRGSATMPMQQVRACLGLAREISELTDMANVAKERGDIPTFNSTVGPYNAAQDRWNRGCTTPYKPADMIRAENDAGVRMCRFTRTPCMSEAERNAVLARERGKQGASTPAPSARIRETTKIASSPAAQTAPRPAPAPSSPSLLSWWLEDTVPATGTRYREMPVSQLSVPLARLSMLSCGGTTPSFTATRCAEAKANGAEFSTTEDLDGDGLTELLETGVGITPKGDKVAVLVISDSTNPSRHQVFLREGEGFSGVFRFDESLSWADCMECSIGVATIKWDARRGEAVLEARPGVVLSYTSPMANPRPAPAVAAVNDLDARTALRIDTLAREAAIRAQSGRQGHGKLSPEAEKKELDEFVAIYESAVRQQVSTRLGALDSVRNLKVATRIYRSNDVATTESAEACVDKIFEGREAGPTCDGGYDDAFINAYERRLRREQSD